MTNTAGRATRWLPLVILLTLVAGCGAADTTTLAQSPEPTTKPPAGFSSQECEFTTADGTRVVVALAIPDGSPRTDDGDRVEGFPGGVCGFGEWTDLGHGGLYLAEDAPRDPAQSHKAAQASEGDGGDEGTEKAEYDDNDQMFGGLDGAVASHWSYSDGVPVYIWLAEAGGVTLFWSINQANDSAKPDPDGVDLSVAKTIRDSVRITLP